MSRVCLRLHSKQIDEIGGSHTKRLVSEFPAPLRGSLFLMFGYFQLRGEIQKGAFCMRTDVSAVRRILFHGLVRFRS